MGIRILQKKLSIDVDNNIDQLDILTDISMACDSAIAILNDLLNYDKLEDGNLLVEVSRRLNINVDDFYISTIYV